MKTLNEKLDHVLKTLIDYGEVICLFQFYQVDSSLPQENQYSLSEEYFKMFEPLQLSNSQFIELLQILKEDRYVEYDVIEILPQANADSPSKAHSIWFQNTATGSITCESNSFIGYKILCKSYELRIGQCQKVVLTLRGKFFYEQGGFQGEEMAKIRDKERIVKHDAQIRLLTFWVALGSIVGAVYYLIEIGLFVYHHFFLACPFFY